MKDFFDNYTPLFSFPFFGAVIPIRRKQEGSFIKKAYLLPRLQGFFDEEVFADIYAAFDDAAIHFHFVVKGEGQVQKEYQKGDSIELFFNTKGEDGRTFFTQFCHHFVLTAEPLDGARFREVTKFRTEETHTLEVEENITISSKVMPGKYYLDFSLPFSSLHGYEKSGRDKMTFFYRINRPLSSPQSLAASHKEYNPEKTPLFWTKLRFVEV